MKKSAVAQRPAGVVDQARLRRVQHPDLGVRPGRGLLRDDERLEQVGWTEIGRLLGGKFSSAVAVWMPECASSGIISEPRESVSTRPALPVRL